MQKQPRGTESPEPRGCCHAVRPCGLPPERLSSVATLLVDLALLVLQVLVRLDRGSGKAVVLPPGHQRGHGGDASGDQLLHGGALDGQHGLAAGAENLVGQGQQQAGGACDGTGGDLVVQVIHS